MFVIKPCFCWPNRLKKDLINGQKSASSYVKIESDNTRIVYRKVFLNMLKIPYFVKFNFGFRDFFKF